MPKNVEDIAIAELEMPRFENGRPLLIAGLDGRYTVDTLDDLPALWDRFSIHLGKVRGQVGRAAYGACSDMFTGTGNFHYLAGVEVSDSSALPEEFSLVHIPAQRYVIFSHRKHVSMLRYTVNTIWSQWFPASNYQAARATDGAADSFERYGEDFNPRLGAGDIELWIDPLGRVTVGNAWHSGNRMVGNCRRTTRDLRTIRTAARSISNSR